MRCILIFLFFVTVIPVSRLIAQDALPKITVKNFSGKIIVSWFNDYTRIAKVINIQRSYDSLKNYITIGSVLNPQNRENGFADEKPPYNNMYYRVFVAFDGGNYLFSKVVRPGTATLFTSALSTGDSIALYHIKSPLAPITSRIYTSKENNVIISLPDAETKKYVVKFYDDNNKLIFELNKLHDPYLVVDKTNFIHAGWFYFEIYEKGKLMERDKFYLSREDKVLATPTNEKGWRNK